MGQIKSVIVMVLVQIAIAGMNVLYKLAANDGMSLRVMIVAYRFIFATAFLLPLAFYVDRGSRPKLAWMAKMSKRYPFHYSSIALVSTMGAIENVAYALCFEREWAQWKLGWNIRLLTVAYSGNCVLWNSLCFDGMVYTHEGSVVCVGLQPSHAGACCSFRLSPSKPETSSRNGISVNIDYDGTVYGAVGKCKK
ncbi:hypothetical protein L484_024676 [Morus notabilis]|uniref:WAT1-related protein n=1 Tax=Morus notabilis TaxID=981085 RepID=W9R4K1_9ROSA|nr:hypothetical protein L484_024676 [Morus notabilis]